MVFVTINTPSSDDNTNDHLNNGYCSHFVRSFIALCLSTKGRAHWLMRELVVVGAIVAAFVAGAFVASPELRAYAANTTRSSDIINNSILSVDIKDGEVKTVDIANDAITALKIKNLGVSNADLAASSVSSSKIQDGAVQAIDIATDAVTADEIKGVTKLMFAEITSGPFELGPQEKTTFGKIITGAQIGDNVIVTANNAFGDDIVVIGAMVEDPNAVAIQIKNDGDTTTTVPVVKYSLIIYKIG